MTSDIPNFADVVVSKEGRLAARRLLPNSPISTYEMLLLQDIIEVLDIGRTVTDARQRHADLHVQESRMVDSWDAAVREFLRLGLLVPRSSGK